MPAARTILLNALLVAALPACAPRQAGDATPGHRAACTAYADAVAQACLDGIARGLALSCTAERDKLEVARAAGRADEPGACEQAQASLAARRATASMEPPTAAGPSCKRLTQRWVAQCLPQVTTHAWSPACRDATALTQPAAGRSREQACSLALGLLGQAQTTAPAASGADRPNP